MSIFRLQLSQIYRPLNGTGKHSDFLSGNSKQTGNMNTSSGSHRYDNKVRFYFKLNFHVHEILVQGRMKLKPYHAA